MHATSPRPAPPHPLQALQSGPVQFAFNVRPSFTHFGVGVYDTTEPECQAPPGGQQSGRLPAAELGCTA